MSAKVAPRNAQGAKDPIVIGTASDLGQITSNMAGKVWQKIMMVQHQLAVDAPATSSPAPPAGTSQIGYSSLSPGGQKSRQG